MGLPPFFANRVADLPAFRIAPDDSNYFVILHDGTSGGYPNVCVIEIFEPGGRTPPNSHAAAFEFFFVLAGEGRANCGEAVVTLTAGASLLIPPGGEHVIENTGSGKLYTLTVMTPDENFAQMIRSGTPVTLGQDDIALLSGGERQ